VKIFKTAPPTRCRLSSHSIRGRQSEEYRNFLVFSPARKKTQKLLQKRAIDSTAAEENGRRYDFVFVDQIGFEKHAPKIFAALAASFAEYRILPGFYMRRPNPCPASNAHN
jgi:hypothetical protein